MRFARRTTLCLFLLISLAIAWPAQAGTLGRGMEQLVQLYETNNPKLEGALALHIASPQKEILVQIRLEKGVSADQAVAQLSKQGFRLQAVSLLDPTLMEGYLPLGLARNVSSASGVHSVLAVVRPLRMAGAVQSQAVAVQKADLAQARGIDGTGVKIGVLSDSYASVTDHPNAADDMATGDLPPDVVVIEDLAPGDGSDEGRGMLQLVHDVAPGSKLAFATAFNGEVDFSNNILKMRRDFNADVIVDDVIYYDEPMFSDGLLAQTVDQVVSEGAAYFASAGNNGLEGYESNFMALSFSDAQKLVRAGKLNLDLETLKKLGLAPKSFHIFGYANGVPDITQKFTSFFGDILDFQWDEPFGLDKVKTDYNIYIFDKDGNFLDPNDPNTPVYFSTDNNLQTDEALELAQVLSGEYQIVIGNMNNGPARHIKYVVVNGTGESERQNASTIWGHAAARKGQAVAAMFYGITNFPEDFSAPGPTAIFFDKNGKRLFLPELRLTPQITGIDGADTTFFGFDVDGNGYPNFFGTSAAAPDVAAVAALVVQKAGGPGKIAPANLYRRLQSTATPVRLAIDRTVAATMVGPVAAAYVGDFPRVDTTWRLSVKPFATHNVSSVSINLTAPGMRWSNPASTTTGFIIGVAEGVQRSDITVKRSADLSTLTLTFAPGTFSGGDFLTFANFAFPIQVPVQFEVDADRVEGGVVTVTFDDNTTQTGAFMVGPKISPNFFTGAGLVNADAATK